MTTHKPNAEAVENAKEMLAKYVAPGAKVYTQVVHVARSGMSREITLHVVHNGEIVNITAWAAYVLGWTLNRERFAIKVSGCGMDMCFHTVYELARVLFGSGYALNKENL